MRSPEKVLIRTARLILRLPKRGDEGAMARYYCDNRDYLQPLSPIFAPELFTIRGWRDRIDATLAEYRSGKGLRLALFSRLEPAKVIGIANFTMITSFPTYVCNLGYSIAESEQGKGLMTEALKAATAYAFSELNLHRIEANYMPRNERSGRVLERAGFVIEGRAEDYILINDRWEEHIRTSLTNREWKPPRAI
jgi:[ribosomal protein S5]-alanine N-acetyltransferase